MRFPSKTSLKMFEEPCLLFGPQNLSSAPPRAVQANLEGVAERLERDVVSVASAAGHPSSVLFHVHSPAAALQQWNSKSTVDTLLVEP